MLGVGNSALPFQLSVSLRFHRRGVTSFAALPRGSPESEAEANRRRCLYEVLKVKRNASQIEIKTAYRTLAKLYHPDAAARFMNSSIASSSSEEDGRDFIEIHDAYATLSDPDARAVYDLRLKVGSRRRWVTAGLSELRRAGSDGFYKTRRWETDQCW